MPWLSEALKKSIRHKNKLYLKYKKVRSAFNEDCYKKYKSKLQHLLKVAEKQYFHDLITRYRNNAKVLGGHKSYHQWVQKTHKSN